MQRIELVKPSDNRSSPSSSERIGYRSTGNLRFRIEKNIVSADQKGLPLERQLGPILRALQQTGIKLRERHEEWERQRRISEQRESERQKAERQRQKLFEDVANWSKADQLRRMIARTTELLNGQKADSGYAERWLKWAEAHAAFLDPFSHGSEEFFKHYETDSWVISRCR